MKMKREKYLEMDRNRKMMMNVRSTLGQYEEYFRGMLGLHRENVSSTLGKCQEYKRILSVVF